jgi:hypothetical protein
VTNWLRRNPLAIFLPIQALVAFFHLGLLSPWMDEAGTLIAMRHPVREVIAFAAGDVHPPLYYLLLYAWLHLSLGLDWAVQARALSVIFALLATVALDRYWARFLPDRLRIWLLLLWSLSPCLLLYSRMCRSYSLQTLLVVIGAALLLRLVGKPTWRNGAVFMVAALATLYTHYVPGIALLAAANLLLAHRRLWGPLLAVNVVVASGYTPWIWRLAASLSLWGSLGATYSATGNPLLEIPLKLAYWAISFTMGEAVPDVMLFLGGATLAIALFLLWDGARQYPRTALLTVILGLTGLIGVARWVSYPFVPARMLFLLPFFLWLLVAGAGIHRRAGNLVLDAMLLLSLSGIWCYFHTIGFRNKEYPMPLHQIADYIRQQSTDQNSVLIVDSANSDPVGMDYALDSSRPILRTTDAAAAQALQARLADHRVRTIWFLRNTHEVAPDAPNARCEADLRKSMRPTVFYYQPFSILERAMMHSMGMSDPPWYAQELLEFRR